MNFITRKSNFRRETNEYDTWLPATVTPHETSLMGCQSLWLDMTNQLKSKETS